MSFVVEPVVVAASAYSSGFARESGQCFAAASWLFATHFLGVAFVESCFVGYC